MSRLHLASKATAGHLLGSRPFALPIRDELVSLLELGRPVVVDFENTNPTQSFVDELIGVLVLERGPEVLSQLVFKNCNDQVKSILHFVVADRIDQYEEAQGRAEIH